MAAVMGAEAEECKLERNDSCERVQKVVSRECTEVGLADDSHKMLEELGGIEPPGHIEHIAAKTHYDIREATSSMTCIQRPVRDMRHKTTSKLKFDRKVHLIIRACH